jgi:hypothetical protein
LKTGQVVPHCATELLSSQVPPVQSQKSYTFYFLVRNCETWGSAKQVAAFPTADNSQILAIQSKAETRDSFRRGLRELDVRQTPRGPSAILCFT